MTRFLAIGGAFALLGLAGCAAQKASFSGRSMHWDGRLSAPSSAVLIIDGTERCRGKAEAPLVITVDDCAQVRQASGGMCRDSEAP